MNAVEHYRQTFMDMLKDTAATGNQWEAKEKAVGKLTGTGLWSEKRADELLSGDYVRVYQSKTVNTPRFYARLRGETW